MTNRHERPTHVHRETAREAGVGMLSPLSVLAGVLCAYGAFAIVAAVVGAALAAADVDTEFRSNDWTGSGAVASLASAAVLFFAYLFGGYVAGRMARRAGLLHGTLVFVVSLVVGGVAGGVVSALADSTEIGDNLRSIGVPTTMDQLTDVAVAGAVLSLVAVLVGSLLGGALGERWHTKLARRVADPEIGITADERSRLEQEEAERRARIDDHDDALRRDLDADAPTADPAIVGRRTPLISHPVDDDVDLRDDEPRLTESEWRERELSRTHRS
jgi:hypothetical protein